MKLTCYFVNAEIEIVMKQKIDGSDFGAKIKLYLKKNGWQNTQMRQRNVKKRTFCRFALTQKILQKVFI